MARMAAQQEAAASAMEASSSTNLSTARDGLAQRRAQSLVEHGNITTGGEASQRLRSLSPPLNTQTECDDLLDALQDRHEEGTINLQTYRMYADTLMAVRPQLAAAQAGPVRTRAGNLSNAINAIRQGMPFEQARSIYGPNHPDDLAAMRAAAQAGPVRTRAGNLSDAINAIRQGMPFEQARSIYGPNHPDDLAAMRAAAQAGPVRTRAGNLSNAINAIRQGMPFEQARSIYGPNHPDDLAAMRAAAQALNR